MSLPLDVLLVLRAYTELYPPTVNQANLLAEAGLRVGVIDLSADGVNNTLNPAIRRFRAHRWWNSKTEAPPSLLQRLANQYRFRQTVKTVIREHRPKVVIAYDILAAAFVPPQPRVHKTVYHFHELPEPDPCEGLGTKTARTKTAGYARAADLIVFSDAMRAKIYQDQIGLPAAAKIVMNCPRRIAQIAVSPLREKLVSLGFPQAQAVCYLGSIGLDQGILPAAASMKYWPADSVFVLVGKCSDEMRQRILSRAAEANAEKRILFLGSHPHAEALALIAGGDLGLSLIQPNTENWRHSAGAINKRFEYMALGLPQVSSNGPGVAEIIEQGNCGACIDLNNPEAIGQTVRQLLENNPQRQQFSTNARALHLNRYNYETQFAEVLNWIQRAAA